VGRHHSRAHRFSAAAAWSADAAGLAVLRLVTGWLFPAGAPVVIAADDTMFRRAGRKVHAAYWGYDGSLKVPKGGKKVSRGNTFVIAAVIAELPFLRRPLGHRGRDNRTNVISGRFVLASSWCLCACRGWREQRKPRTGRVAGERAAGPTNLPITGPAIGRTRTRVR
jgi:DDE superfamily endonuclease